MELRKLDADNGDGARLFLKALRDIGKTDERPEEFADESLDLLFRASDYNNLTRIK